jgi:hypothetical protein
VIKVTPGHMPKDNASSLSIRCTAAIAPEQGSESRMPWVADAGSWNQKPWPTALVAAMGITSLRLQTESGPPDEGCSESDGRSEAGCKLVIAGRDAAPILEVAKHSLDEVALFVGILVEGMAALAGRVVGDDQGRTTVDQELLQAGAV